MALIYLDTCVVIDLVEDDGDDLGDLLRQELTKAKGKEFAISPLVKMECLVGPIRDDNHVLRKRYERDLTRFVNLPLDDEVMTRAAEIRAEHGLAAQDAIHLAAAQIHDCTEFWTNDKRLNKVAGGLDIKILPSS
jgi:predicted nucleic acid-binding protein